MSFAVPSNTLFLQSELDLPAPVGGVITLPENRTILVDKSEDPLVVPNGVQLRVPSTSVLKGWDADQNGIVGNVDAPLIIGDGDGLVLTDLFLRNFSADPNAFCAETENGYPGVINGRASRIERVSVGGRGGVRVQNATAVQVNVLSRCSGDGVYLRGATAGVQLLQCVFQPDIADSPRHVVLDGGQHDALRISDAAFVLTDGSVGIQALNDPTLNLVRVGDSDFIPQPGGGVPGVPVAGNIAGAIPLGPNAKTDVLFLDDFGVEESSFSGAMAIPSNANQVTNILAAGVGVFVRIGSGNAAHPLFQAQNPNSRFQVVDPVAPGAPQAQRQLLVYAGPEPVTVNVQANASIRQNGIYQLLASMRIVYLPNGGAPQPQTAFDTVLADGFSGGGAVGEVVASAPRITVNPGDAFYVEIANNTNTGSNPLTNLIVTNITLGYTVD